MLIPNYYTILNQQIEGHSALFRVALNSDCKVYEGHFPGSPVSPGVCNIQLILECAGMVLGTSLRLLAVSKCKLTTLVTPYDHPEVEVRVELSEKNDTIYALNAAIGKGEDIYLQLKAEVEKE